LKKITEKKQDQPLVLLSSVRRRRSWGVGRWLQRESRENEDEDRSRKKRYPTEIEKTSWSTGQEAMKNREMGSAIDTLLKRNHERTRDKDGRKWRNKENSATKSSFSISSTDYASRHHIDPI
jgi:hypothetical protein